MAIRLGWLDDRGKMVFDVVIGDFQPDGFEIVEKNKVKTVVVKNYKEVYRLDNVRGETNAKVRCGKNIEKYGAIDATDIAAVEKALGSPQKVTSGPKMTKEQSDKLKHLKSLERHLLISEGRSNGVKVEPKWSDAEIREAIMEKLFDENGKPVEPSEVEDEELVEDDDSAEVDPEIDDSDVVPVEKPQKPEPKTLKELGFDDKQIGRMTEETKRTLLKKQISAEGAAILKNGTYQFVPGHGPKPAPKEQPKAPPVKVQAPPKLAALTVDIIKATRGDELKKLCVERDISIEDKSPVAMKADLIGWLEEHPENALHEDAPEEVKEVKPQAKVPKADGEGGIADSDTPLSEVRSWGMAKMRPWLSLHKQTIGVKGLQALSDLELAVQKPRKELVALLAQYVDKIHSGKIRGPTAATLAKAGKIPLTGAPKNIKTEKAKTERFEVAVTHKDWPFNNFSMSEDGEPLAARWYKLGFTSNEAEADAAAQKWLDQGYHAVVTKSLTTSLKVENTLWTSFGPPIVSLAQLPEGKPDLWVGDNLPSHLRALGMTIEQYRKETSYAGPAIVNRATVGMEKMRARQAQVLKVRLGQMVIEILGDAKIVTYRIDAANTVQIQLTILATSDGLRLGERVKMTPTELFKNTKPFTKWSDSVQKQYGVEPAVEIDDAAPETLEDGGEE